MYYLGLDIGGTKIAAVVMDAGRNGRYRCPTQKASYPQFVESVVAFIDQIRHDMPADDDGDCPAGERLAAERAD
jgi:fructokinase